MKYETNRYQKHTLFSVLKLQNKRFHKNALIQLHTYQFMVTKDVWMWKKITKISSEMANHF